MWKVSTCIVGSLDKLQVNEAKNISGDPYDGWNKKHPESLQVHGHVVESWTPILMSMISLEISAWRQKN